MCTEFAFGGIWLILIEAGSLPAGSEVWTRDIETHRLLLVLHDSIFNFHIVFYLKRGMTSVHAKNSIYLI